MQDEQRELEIRTQEEGVVRRRKMSLEAKRSGDATRMPVPRRLAKRSELPMANAILAAIVENEEAWADRGRVPVYWQLIQELGADAAAALTSSVIVNAAFASPAVPTAANSIGTRIESALKLKRLKKDFPYVIRRLRATGRLGGPSEGKHLRSAMEWAGMEWDDWGAPLRKHVGVLLLDLFVQTTGVVEYWMDKRGRKYPIKRIAFSKRAADWLDKWELEDEGSHPAFMPMTEVPVDHAPGLDGGYQLIEYPMVKRRPAEWHEALSANAPAEVFNAINAIQRTPWAVNEDVLEVFEVVMQNPDDWKVPGCAVLEEVAVPPEPGPGACDEEWKIRNIAAAKAHDRNRRTRSKRTSLVATKRVAQRMRGQVIYFPQMLDWRGRIYPVPHYLSPQGMDIQRALLSFAEAKELTPEGWRWLRIHGANLAGHVDKQAFGAREQWVIDNQHVIEAIGRDPLTNQQWWKGWDDCPEVDEPFGFLAFCCDYWQALGTGKSSLPIAMDGTCSGLQHYSAMLRDERGGAAVNLVPRDEPADVYAEVAAEVERILAADGSSIARQWLKSGRVGRKLCKQPTMTTPYNVTQQGIYEQIQGLVEDWTAADGGELAGFEDGSGYEATVYITPIVMRAIDAVVAKANEAMTVLKRAARCIARSGALSQWVSPVGFVVLQDYRRMRRTRPKTRLASGRLDRSYLIVETNVIDVKKAVNGIAPNVVHSLDAAHLMRSVNATVSQAQGFVSFNMIHDSFGCHAADAPLLAECLRVEFVRLYEGDVLADILEQLKVLCDERNLSDWPETPTYGDLDLSLVLDSDFFFG